MSEIFYINDLDVDMSKCLKEEMKRMARLLSDRADVSKDFNSKISA